MGNFETASPTAARWRGLVSLTTRLVREQGLSPEHVVGHGSVPQFLDAAAHEQTACPGRGLDLGALRAAVAAALAR